MKHSLVPMSSRERYDWHINVTVLTLSIEGIPYRISYVSLHSVTNSDIIQLSKTRKSNVMSIGPKPKIGHYVTLKDTVLLHHNMESNIYLSVLIWEWVKRLLEHVTSRHSCFVNAQQRKQL